MLSTFARPVPPAIENVNVTQEAVTIGAEGGNIAKAPNSGTIPDIVVAGALACDYSCDFAALDKTSTSPQLHTSNPAIIRQSLGGVAHNVAKAAHYLGPNVKLISLIGNDLDGNSARAQLESQGMRTDGVQICTDGDARTSRYVAVNDARKDLVVAMADMNLLNTHGGAYLETKWKDELQAQRPQWFIADANWESQLLLQCFHSARDAGCRTVLEPVSVAKGSRLFDRGSKPDHLELSVFPRHVIDIMAPNAMELSAMHSMARSEGLLEDQDWWKTIDTMGIPSSGIRPRLVDVTSAAIVDQGLPQQAIQLLPFVPCIVTKLGPEGVLLTMLLAKDDLRLQSPEAAPYIISRNRSEDAESPVGGVYVRLYPAVARLDESKIVSVNGVGDTFLGALIAALEKTGKGVEELVDFAQSAAVLTLQSPEAVSPALRELSMTHLC
jgi:pseudouridine-5'-phosphate glycosidase/pseudouridine kinase